jgi:hypothetical protein
MTSAYNIIRTHQKVMKLSLVFLSLFCLSPGYLLLVPQFQALLYFLLHVVLSLLFHVCLHAMHGLSVCSLLYLYFISGLYCTDERGDRSEVYVGFAKYFSYNGNHIGTFQDSWQKNQWIHFLK